jgi:hypothetical protein
MLVNDLMKDVDLPDLGRLLQQTSGESTEMGYGDGPTTEGCITVVGGIVVIMVAFIGCVIMLRNRAAPVSTTRVNAMDTPKTTLAERKHAILKLFEISQVAMVSYETVTNAAKVRESSPCITNPFRK